MAQSLKHCYERLVLDHPLPVLIVVAIVAVVLAVAIPKARLDASADSLTLENDNSIDYFRDTVTRYGTSDYLVVTYTPKEDLFSDVALHRLQAMSSELLTLEQVESITSILNLPLLNSPKVALSELSQEPRTLLMPDTDRALAEREFIESPIYRNMVLSDDGQTTGMLVNLKLDRHYFELVERRDDLRYKRKHEGLTDTEMLELERVSEEFLAHRTFLQEQSAQNIVQVRAILDKYRSDAQIHLGGITMITADMIAFIQSDLVIFGSGILLFIICMLIIIFRQLRWVLLPLTTCCLSVVMMLGYLAWVDWRLTVISSNFVALLLIITLSMTVHLVVRYRELLREKPDAPQREVVWDMVRFMSKPCLYTILTTMVAFISLVVSDIRPVIDFGWMMTMGLALAFTIVFIVMPASMMLMQRAKPDTGKDYTKMMTRRLAWLTEHYGNTILFLYLVTALLSFYGITQLKVENRFIDYFDESTEIYQGMELIDKKLGGTTPLDIILDVRPQSGETAAEQTAPVADEDFDDFADDPFAEDEFADDEFGDEFDDGFGDTFEGDAFGESETSEAPTSYWFTQSGLQEISQLHNFVDELSVTGKVNSLAMTYELATQMNEGELNDFELVFLYQLLPDDIKAALIEPYLSLEANQARISVRVKESDGSLRRGELIETIRNYAVDDMGLAEEQINFTSMVVLYNNMLESLFRSQILTLGAVFVGILLMFMTLFRSFYIAIIAIVPNILAAALVLGIMGLAGIPLDMMTITIAAIVIGIGVDHSIHYIHRFKREYAIDHDYLAAMYRSHGSIGKAMYYTTITIMVGFSILGFSNFTPSLYFGLLTSMAMFAALVGALLLLPKLMLVLKPLGKNNRQQ